MAPEWLARRDRASVAEIEQALAAMVERVQALGDALTWSDGDLVELLAIYNSASYLFLYIESNAVSVSADHLSRWRDALQRDPVLDERLAARLEGLTCADPDLEDSRVRFVRHLERKARASDRTADEVGACLARSRAIFRALEVDQAHLLSRLGAAPSSVRPLAAFYRLMERTGSSQTRAKLGRAWDGTAARHVGALEELVDRMVVARRAQTASDGESVLAHTFSRCAIPSDLARTFLDRFLALAVEDHRRLVETVRREIGDAGRPFDHFPYFVGLRRGAQSVPLFRVADCLDFIFDVASRVFGLAIRRMDSGSNRALAVEVAGARGTSGYILFDLWDVGPVPRAANQTQGLRNRTDWHGLIQLPVAHVSCKFQRTRDGEDRINFQNLHSLFHEFGHALNHILIRKRLPNQSGLEYLPIERLEHLSMWFERWVFHPALGARLGLSEDEQRGLALCRSIKRLEYRRTHLDRAVTAALDFEVHDLPDGGVRDAFARIDARAGIAAWCRIEDYVPYFFWPMMTANPGGYFGYLWSASFSAECFQEYLAPSLDRIPTYPAHDGPFAGCFDFDANCAAPDPRANFAFYDQSVDS